jgi:hypothetical protein
MRLCLQAAKEKRMANMGYCRFQNTYSDLCDCDEHMDDELSQDEAKYRKRIIGLCKRIVDCYGDEEEDV